MKDWPNFRYLTADEIEARVSQVNEKGCSLLLYKNARCDMNLLDETIGPENWQRRHYECKGNLFCSVGIRTSENEWIWKDDAGAESYTEKEKGEASDSFKRACFNWGIGRELYTSPFIWISAMGKDDKPNVRISDSNGKKTTYDKFDVTYIRTENGKIVALNIENKSLHRTVFVFGDCFQDYHTCCVCGKQIPEEIYEGSMKANGKPYCSGTCKRKDNGN